LKEITGECTMLKRLPLIFLVVLAAGLTSACAGVGGSSNNPNKMIVPGDKIGDFVVSSGEQGKFNYGFSVDCSELGSNNAYSCKATVGEVINVSTGLYDTTGKGTLDEIWTHSNYQMFINDRPVDLAAFGTIDYNYPQVGVIRFANVVITTNKAGEITVKDSGLFDTGDPFTSTSTYAFSKP
jgi:hypothetical protein